MNSDLKTLHDTLSAQHQAFYKRLDSVTDPALAKAIVTEMSELLHRVDLVQGLLFHESTAGLAKSVAQVKAADRKATKALKEAKTAADVVKGTSKFLTAVDKAIDVAKKLAPLAGIPV
jgi:hypothetical protein